MSDPYGSYDPHAAPGWPAGQGMPPTFTVDRRPGTVTAAAVITMVLSSLAAAGGIVFAILGAADRGGLRKQLVDSSSFRDQYSISDIDAVITAMVVVSIVTVVLGLLAIVLAVGVLRRSRVARVLLTVLAAITIVPSAFASFGAVGLPWLAGAITVIVLLYVGGANRWFSRDTGQPPYAGYPYAGYGGYPPAY